MEKTTEFVKRAVLFKLAPDKKGSEELYRFKNLYGDAVVHTLNHIQRVYFSYEKIPLEKMGICQMCGAKDVQLSWRHKTLRKDICGKCFNQLWSIFTLTKADGFQKDLITAFPELSPAHKGYYAGVIKMSVPIFKSYIKKKDERGREINRLTIQAQAETNPIRQNRIMKQIEEKKKGIKELQFSRNVIYLGNAGMFEFTKKFNKYYLHITDWEKKRNKRTYEVRIGRDDSYTKHTHHNKYKILNDCIDNKENKVLFGKILWRDDHFEFMYPKRDPTTSITTRKGIEDWYKKHKNAYIISIVFGIKTPIHMVVQKNRKIIDVHNFGDGSLWHRINHAMAHKAKVMRKLALKHKSKWKRNKAKKRFYKKLGDSESRRIKYATHKLTTEVISYLQKKYKEGIIIMRDSKGIKRINYPGIYRIVLHRWNVELYKTFLEYKEKLSNFHIYMLPYKETNNLRCGRCGKEAKEDDKPVKILTQILNSGMDRKSILQHKFNMLQRKIISLLKYPQTTKILRYIQETSSELKKVKELLEDSQVQKNYSLFECSHCGYKNNFLTNDAISLSRSLYSPCALPNASQDASPNAEVDTEAA